MASSGMLRRVALVRTDVSEERRASFIRVTRICELGTTLTVTSNRRTQRASVAPFFRMEIPRHLNKSRGDPVNSSPALVTM
jgi:hypothetical protein